MKTKNVETYPVSQAKLNKSPFDFIDMSVKEPWKENEWKARCKTKIKRSHGIIVLLSKNTYHNSVVRYEVKCANEEDKPIIGMHIKKNEKRAILPELKGKRIITWTWKNMKIL